MNIKLTIAYDGSRYSGWQIQPNGMTIQELMQKAVRSMTGEENNVVGAGRTDAGVHALAQVASFRTEKGIPPDGFRRGINSLLPPDIRVLEVEEVSEDFHPIRDAKSKHYCYVIKVGEFEHPLSVNRSWCIKRHLDIDAINKAASYLVGEHDFSSFRAADGCDENAVRSVFEAFLEDNAVAVIASESEAIQFNIKGSGFLKNMVRNIVGTLVDVGLGKINPDEFKDILIARDRKKAGVCAPASGLYLVSVEY